MTQEIEFCTSANQRQEFKRRFILLWVSLTLPHLTQGQTTCSVSPAHVGEETQLECYFPEDVSQTKIGFSILLSSEQRKLEEIMDCLWEDGEMFCDRKARGYDYRDLASNRFFVRLPSVSLNQAGIYHCVLGHDIKNSRACNLIIKQGPCTVQLTVGTMTLSGMCIFEETSQSSKGNKCSWYLYQTNLKFVESSALTSTETSSGFKTSCALSYSVHRDSDNTYRFNVELDNGVQYDTNVVYIERPKGLDTDCPRYVPEGTDVNCQCSLKSLGFPPALASWDRYENRSHLTLSNVRQQDNTSILGICYLLWPSETVESQEQIIVQVAYGPHNESLSIEGPTTFIMDGSLLVTVTCTAAEVNPAPLITWEGVTCSKGSTVSFNSSCTFKLKPSQNEPLVVSCIATNSFNRRQTAVASTIVDLTYPPPIPPTIKGIRDGQNLHVGQILTLTCTVEGGKPLVSFVNFTCGHRLDTTDTMANNSVFSSVIFDPVTATDDGTECFCTAFWSPGVHLYPHRAWIMLNITKFEDKTTGESHLIILIGSILAVIFVFVIITIISRTIYLKGRPIYDHPQRGEEHSTEWYQSLSLQSPTLEQHEDGIYEEVQSSPQSTSLKYEGICRHPEGDKETCFRTSYEKPLKRSSSDYLHPVHDTGF